MSNVISFVPKTLVNLCRLNSDHQNKLSTYISDTCQKDSFLRILVEKRFNFSFDDEGFVKKLSEISLKNYRDELSLAYLSYHYDKSYFSKNAKGDLEKILELENEFKEFIPNGGNLIFLLCYYLKNKDIIAIKNGTKSYFAGFDFNLIKDILSMYMPNQHRSDWLIILIQSLINVYQEDATKKVQENKGKFYSLLGQMDRDQKKILILTHLDYGQAIDDSDYFLFNKV